MSAPFAVFVAIVTVAAIWVGAVFIHTVFWWAFMLAAVLIDGAYPDTKENQ